MKPIEPWHIVVANLAVLAVVALAHRWNRDLLFGALGIAIIILPTMFAYFAGRLSISEGLAPLLGVVLLAADLKGKLPSRSQVRGKLGMEKRR
jgi:hypothetical protein